MEIAGLLFYLSSSFRWEIIEKEKLNILFSLGIARSSKFRLVCKLWLFLENISFSSSFRVSFIWEILAVARLAVGWEYIERYQRCRWTKTFFSLTHTHTLSLSLSLSRSIVLCLSVISDSFLGVLSGPDWPARAAGDSPLLPPPLLLLVTKRQRKQRIKKILRSWKTAKGLISLFIITNGLRIGRYLVWNTKKINVLQPN